MTLATPSLAALPTELPPVEREAVIPLGFVAGAGISGIKASGRPDLAIVATEPGPDGVRVAAAAAAVFTPNAFAAAPVRLSKAHLVATDPAGEGRFGWATGVISTSGCANAATGAAGDADQAEVADLLAAALATTTDLTLLLSTGIIGTRLPVDLIRAGIAAVVPGLAATDEALAAAAVALQTTDSVPKTATTTITLPDRDG
ncbi:MAG: glutamate N-acetyltransferase / amino-acid N-acetyltransferase, partial [Chloroflexota bacterium]|nr:glutamate N-acetyltransferase / amino-acid N-acetyltransferase [Chloroflexota bacterium]